VIASTEDAAFSQGCAASDFASVQIMASFAPKAFVGHEWRPRITPDDRRYRGSLGSIARCALDSLRGYCRILFWKWLLGFGHQRPENYPLTQRDFRS